jgi:hypothetical protein
MPPPEDRAELLRKDLRTVGVTRAELHIERDPLQRAIVFHDLRDTGLTHMAVRGDSPVVVQWAGGHTDFKTTQGYIARGQVEARRIGAPLPPLPPELFSGSDRLDPPLDPDPIVLAKVPETVAFFATPMGIEGPTREPDSRKDSAPLADGPRGDWREVPRGGDASRTLATVASNDDLDAALVRAVLDGDRVAADEIARMLRARREASAGNVVALRRTS